MRGRPLIIMNQNITTLHSLLSFPMHALRRSPAALVLAASAAPRARVAHPTSSRAMSVLASDQTTPEFKFYHKTHYAMLGLVPLGLLIPTSALSTPIDLLLAVAIPVHGQIGMNWIITDYVPPSARMATRAVLLGATLFSIAGLTKLSLDGEGPGFMGSLKALWNKPSADDKKKH